MAGPSSRAQKLLVLVGAVAVALAARARHGAPPPEPVAVPTPATAEPAEAAPVPSTEAEPEASAAAEEPAAPKRPDRRRRTRPHATIAATPTSVTPAVFVNRPNRTRGWKQLVSRNFNEQAVAKNATGSGQ
jgi:hypothetical protein